MTPLLFGYGMYRCIVMSTGLPSIVFLFVLFNLVGEVELFFKTLLFDTFALALVCSSH
jgi:hypothetical protein